jgi:2-dehydropantoate 2-reductase
VTFSQDSRSRILVIGTGAIGSFYGSALQIAGADVSAVCRSEYDVVRENGFEIESKRLGNRVFHPAQTVRSAADYQGGPPDYLILAVKVVAGIDRVALIRDAVGPNTVIVLIENGVEIESEIAQAFPDNELISALAFVQVSRVAPGRVVHYAFGDLHFGNYPSGLSDQAKYLAGMLEDGGIKTVFNPISVLGGGLDTDDILSAIEGTSFVRRAMEEVCAVASAAGHPLPSSLVEQYINGTRKAPAYKTSMALDLEHGRPMEVEVILGNAVRAGRRENVRIPLLESLYALMKMVERKNEKLSADD